MRILYVYSNVGLYGALVSKVFTRRIWFTRASMTTRALSALVTRWSVNLSIFVNKVKAILVV